MTLLAILLGVIVVEVFVKRAELPEPVRVRYDLRRPEDLGRLHRFAVIAWIASGLFGASTLVAPWLLSSPRRSVALAIALLVCAVLCGVAAAGARRELNAHVAARRTFTGPILDLREDGDPQRCLMAVDDGSAEVTGFVVDLVQYEKHRIGDLVTVTVSADGSQLHQLS